MISAAMADGFKDSDCHVDALRGTVGRLTDYVAQREEKREQIMDKLSKVGEEFETQINTSDRLLIIGSADFVERIKAELRRHQYRLQGGSQPALPTGDDVTDQAPVEP